MVLNHFKQGEHLLELLASMHDALAGIVLNYACVL
jgi:hypothetical protein